MEMQRFSTFWRELISWGQSLAYQFGQNISAFDVYEQVNIDVLVELLAQQSNLCLWQNERNLLASAEKIPAFIGVSYIIAVNQLQIIPMNWDCDHIVGSVGIQNKMPRSLKKRLFADNTDKGHNNGPINEWIISSGIFKCAWAKYWWTYGKIQRTFLDEAILENEIYKMGTYMVVSMC